MRDRLNSLRLMVKTNYIDNIKGPDFGSLCVDEITYLSNSFTQNLEIRWSFNLMSLFIPKSFIVYATSQTACLCDVSLEMVYNCFMNGQHRLCKLRV